MNRFPEENTKNTARRNQKGRTADDRYYEEKRKRSKTLDRIKDEYYGEAGTPERGRLERELETLRIGFKIRSAREKRNMTQAELASHIDKKRTFISKVENHGQNITLKTLFDIVERGRVAHGDGCSVSPPTNTQCTGNTSFVINQLVIILLVINILVIFVDVLKTG